MNSGDTDTVINILVNGDGDVKITGSATLHQFTLTLNVVFGGGAISSIPQGVLNIDGEPVTGEMTFSGNVATVSLLVDVGTHTVSISYEGYIDNSVDVAVSGDTTAIIHAVPRLADETGSQTGPEAHYVLWYRQGVADGDHTVTGLEGVSGTFSTDGMTVTIEDATIKLEGFSNVVGSVVFDIGSGSTLTIVVIPDAVPAGGSQTI